MNVADILTKHGADLDAHTKVLSPLWPQQVIPSPRIPQESTVNWPHPTKVDVGPLCAGLSPRWTEDLSVGGWGPALQHTTSSPGRGGFSSLSRDAPPATGLRLARVSSGFFHGLTCLPHCQPCPPWLSAPRHTRHSPGAPCFLVVP